jgi:hypothetical protein
MARVHKPGELTYPRDNRQEIGRWMLRPRRYRPAQNMHPQIDLAEDQKNTSRALLPVEDVQDRLAMFSDGPIPGHEIEGQRLFQPMGLDVAELLTSIHGIQDDASAENLGMRVPENVKHGKLSGLI